MSPILEEDVDNELKPVEPAARANPQRGKIELRN
jgi:hypothetical protein